MFRFIEREEKGFAPILNLKRKNSAGQRKRKQDMHRIEGEGRERDRIGRPPVRLTSLNPLAFTLSFIHLTVPKERRGQPKYMKRERREN